MNLLNLAGFLRKPVDTRCFAFLRIATGLVALVELLVLWPNLKDIYGSHGYIEWVISQHLLSVPHLPTMAGLADFLNPQLITDDNILYLVLSGYIVSLLGLVMGYRANLMAFLACLLHLTINNSAIMYGYGVETFTHVGLFYLIFMPSATHWTLFAKKNRLNGLETGIYARLWITILRIHLCIVYFNAGIAKLSGEDWTTGEAIWRSVAQPSYSQIDMFWMAYVPGLSLLFSWLVLALESAYPLLIWFPLTRKYWLTGILLMHVGIGVLMGLYSFAAIMIVLNVAAFGWDYVADLSMLRLTKLSSLRQFLMGKESQTPVVSAIPAKQE